MTPIEMRAEAASLEAAAKAYLARAKQLRDVAAAVEAIQNQPAFPAALSSSESKGLTSTRVESTLDIDTMEARTRSDSAKFKTGSQNSGKAREKTPFGLWLKEHEKAASVWAAEHKDDAGEMRWSPVAVRAWMLPKGAIGARAIPEEAAKLIAKESKGAAPATDASWPSGISRPRRRPA
jgi:hypothetical protein